MDKKTRLPKVLIVKAFGGLIAVREKAFNEGKFFEKGAYIYSTETAKLKLGCYFYKPENHFYLPPDLEKTILKLRERRSRLKAKLAENYKLEKEFIENSKKNFMRLDDKTARAMFPVIPAKRLSAAL